MQTNQTHLTHNMTSVNQIPYVANVFRKVNVENNKAWLPIGGSVIVILCALLLWGMSLPDINPRNITDFGLVSALPLSFLIALGILTIGFSLVIQRQKMATPVLLAYVVTLIIIIHGTLPLVYDAPRYAWTYKHLGITNYIQLNGSVNPYINAYHNWPGFFALSAFFTKISGFESAFTFAIWAQVFFNLIYLGALLVIFKSCTTDRRLIWLGVWFFYLTSWIGQDYFAPQALGLFFYLVIIGVCLTWFKVTMPSKPTHWPWHMLTPIVSLFNKIADSEMPGDTLHTISPPTQRVGVMAIIILSFVAIISSHQLTPFMTIGSITALAIVRRCSLRNLPILLSVMVIFWITYMASVYMDGHLISTFQSFGQLSRNIDSSLSSLVKSSPGRTFVARTCLGLTASVWSLAFLGGIRRVREGRWDLSILTLAITPFFLVITQSYGGEMMLRIYLFSLPFMAFLAAASLYPSPLSGRSRKTTVITAMLSGVLLTAFLFSYYGNERMNHITQKEVEAVYKLDHTTAPGSLILAEACNYPGRFEGEQTEDIYVCLTNLKEFRGRSLNASDIEAIASLMTSLMTENDYPSAYFYISQSQKAYAELYHLVEPGSLDRLEAAMMQSEHFNPIFSNSDARIFALIEFPFTFMAPHTERNAR